VRSPVSNAWAAELGKPESAGPNFAHYMPVRVLLYDLIGAKLIKKQGKIQSDGEARGKIQDRVEGSAKEMIKLLGELASVDQRMKLYIQPYMLLTDQETERMYPVVKSELATRRMSAENPNGMQLAKRGPSTYIRSFFKADEDDHVIVGEDWSAVELVAIGEASGDPKFVDAYKQVPHKDLHVGTTAAVLEMEVPGLTEDQFKSFKGMTEGMAKDLPPTLRTDLKGQPIHHEKIYGYWRTEIGKGANFEYFYSGWLNRVSERLGWDMETTGEAVERFRDHFPVAEAWRLKIIEEVKENGFITLPDGHRYTRYEATRDWGHEWLHKFQVHGNDAVFGNYNRVVNFMGRKIAKRAGNQTVNARIQGFCAALAKRTALRMQEKIGHEPGIRFMLPIHDELVYSVHRDLAPDFIPLLRETMCSHDDWFKTCRLDAAPSVGLSLEPWGAKAPIGQVELMEPPAVIVGPERAGRPLDRAGIVEVIDYLFEKRASL
jgi:DNA polymerase I-like protein with 3'-5' exonuclease and polymerase domains